MARRTGVLSLVVILSCSIGVSCAPRRAAAVRGAGALETIVVAAEAKSDSVIAVPPATSIGIALQREKRETNADMDLAAWLHKESELNGLQSNTVHPWHILVTYDQYDEDGDNVNSGTYEEFWAGPKKYRRIYKSDNLNQTDYATDRGLFRQGDQRWPASVEMQVRDEIINPFFYAKIFQDFHVRHVERIFGGHTLLCAFVERDPGGLSDPTQYCFEPGESILRYSRGSGWFQTAYNHIVSFQGRNVSEDVDVTKGGKPYLKLHAQTLELMPSVNDADFLPSADAIGPMGQRISGVNPTLIKPGTIERYQSPRGQRVEVSVEFVVGKDGHVVSAHAVSGPEETREACENFVRSSVYAPYFVLDQPVEVEAETGCQFH